MDGFSVKPLTCTKKDSAWSMSLPSVTTEEVSPVLVKLLESSDYAELFVLNAGAVSLADGALAKMISGSCPTESSIELSFELASKVLGTNEQ